MPSLELIRDINQLALPALLHSTYIDYRVVAASTSESHTVPAEATAVVITPEQDLYVKPGGTAAIPAADVTDGSGAFYVPAGVSRPMLLRGVSTLGLISPAAGKVCLEFYF